MLFPLQSGHGRLMLKRNIGCRKRTICWMLADQGNKIYCMISYKVITKASTTKQVGGSISILLSINSFSQSSIFFSFRLKRLLNFPSERFKFEFWSNLWYFQLVESLFQVVQNFKFSPSQLRARHKEADKFKFQTRLTDKIESLKLTLPGLTI